MDDEFVGADKFVEELDADEELDDDEELDEEDAEAFPRDMSESLSESDVSEGELERERECRDRWCACLEAPFLLGTEALVDAGALAAAPAAVEARCFS